MGTAACMAVDSVTGMPAKVAPPRYVKRERLGEGSYGVVYSGVDTHSSPPRPVAIKVHGRSAYDNDCEGTSQDVLLEVAMNRVLPPHANIAQLLDVAQWGDGTSGTSNRVAMIFELMNTDLRRHIEARRAPISDDLLRSYAYQLVRALAHCHRHGVVHRDVKTANILIGTEGVLKLADFGCARLMFGDWRYSPRPLTPEVCTLWYRAPELMLDAQNGAHYGAAVDIWAAGCCLAELFAGRALLRSDCEADHLLRICRLFGPPPPPPPHAFGGDDEAARAAAAAMAYAPIARWCATLGYDKPEKQPPPPFDVAALDAPRGQPTTAARPPPPPHFNELLRAMLDVDPRRRATAEQCLAHPFFADARDALEAALAARGAHT